MENTPEDLEEVETNKYLNLNEGADSDDEEKMGQVVEEEMMQLKSKKTWDKLKIPVELEDRLIQLGFKQPSKIQATVIPIARKTSVFAQSQNGSGKTLSFLIPAILEVDRSIPSVISGKIQPQVIILADTRPLIKQITKIANTLKETVYDDIIIEGVFGGQQFSSNGCHILITTNGNLKNSIQKFIHTSVKLLIIDEADVVMKSDFSNVFLPQLIIKVLNPACKLLLTTATSTDISKNFLNKIQEVKKFVAIELEREQLTLKNVKQTFIRCEKSEMIKALSLILQKIDAQNILIFATSKNILKEVHASLESENHKVASVLSNNMSDRVKEADQNQKNIEDFMAGKYRILISTNLLSRGIDMRKVTLVVNLELPRQYSDEKQVVGQPILADCETYLHRVGRTGRFGDHGIALNIVTDNVQEEMRKQIVEFYDIKMEEIKMESLSSINSELGNISKYNTTKRGILEENI